MFQFFKREKRVLSNPITTDIHSHFIPNVDDGVRSLDESLSLLNEMQKLGYRKLIITPHIKNEVYPNSFKGLKSSLENLKSEIEKENIEIDIEIAAEYYLDDYFQYLLDKEKLLTISNKYLLVETAYRIKPLAFEDMIFSIQQKGYIPILAHPERYLYIKDAKKEFSKMKDSGILFQVNLNSFNGYYGKTPKKNALILKKEGLIDFLGSDIHSKREIESLKNILKNSVYRKILKTNNIKNNNL